MKPSSLTLVRYGAVLALCACASVVATQNFELSTEYVAMPALPNVPGVPAQTISLSARFASCSKTALGDLEKVRASDYVDSVDVWVIVRDVRLISDASFSGIDQLTLQLEIPGDTITVCNRKLSESEQQRSTVTCPFEYRVRAEDLCNGDGSTANTEITIQLTVDTGDVSLTRIGAKLAVDTEVDADVSL